MIICMQDHFVFFLSKISLAETSFQVKHESVTEWHSVTISSINNQLIFNDHCRVTIAARRDFSFHFAMLYFLRRFEHWCFLLLVG